MIDSPDINKFLDAMFTRCSEMGADALTQMKIEYFLEPHAQNTTSPVTIPGIRISGFAIKRLGALK